MASNDKTVPPLAKEATISTKEESKTVAQTSDRGLAGLPSSPKEAAKKEEVIQKAQVDGRALRKKAKMEESVAELQKRLKEAFEVARHLTSQEAVKQQRYYDRKAGAVALQLGDIVMVRTDRFVGKHKVKDWWEGGFVVVKQLEDWPVYKVQCPPSGNRRNPQYRILH